MNQIPKLLYVVSCATAFLFSNLTVATENSGHLNFAWPEGATAHVAEKATKDGNSIEFSYTISLHERAHTTSFQLDYANYDVTRVNGEDAHSPPMRKILEPSLPMLAAWPSLLISHSGHFEGTGDFGTMMQNALTYVENQSKKKMDAQERAALEKLMSSPTIKAGIAQKFGNAWQTWVGLWIGDIPLQGSKLTYTNQIPIGDETLEAPLFKEYAGAGDQGRIKLSAESTLGGTEAAKALQKLVAGIIERADIHKTLHEKVEIKEFRRVNRWSVETDPQTLLPKFARSEQQATIVMSDGQTKEQSEIHEYSFDWSTADSKH